MADVVWTTRARSDLVEVAEYHAARSPEYAEALVRRLLGIVGRLEAFPRSGRSVPGIAAESMREVIYRDYRIIYPYEEEADRVEILSVFHSSRQFGAPPGS